VSEFRRVVELGRHQLAPWLVFRICLTRVEHAGPPLDKIEKTVDGEFPGFGKLVPVKVMDVVDALPELLGRPIGELVTDLGMLVTNRSKTSPLS
jgi:hypothetical protein